MTFIGIISWVATILSLAGQILINNKNKTAFPIWITSNILWIIINVMTTLNIANIVMYIVYTIMNVHGLIKWIKSEKNNSQEIIETNSQTAESFDRKS